MPDQPPATEEEIGVTQHATHPAQKAMQDEDLARRLEDAPEDPDVKLDAGLDESMDASDTPASLQPGGNSVEPAPSSGFDEEAEAELRLP